MSLRLSGTILGCGRSAGAVIPALGSGRYSPGPNIGLPSWRKGSALNFTTNVVWGQPGALATVSKIPPISPLTEGGFTMVSDLFFHELLLCGLLWLCVMLLRVWSYNHAAPGPTTPKPAKPSRQHSGAPEPFSGLTHKPPCVACEQAAQEPATPPPPAPPPAITSTHGCPRQVDTSQQFCPHPDCDYRGWVGRGNLSANGHPNGGPWRQLYCSQCEGYFLETVGTPLYGKRVSADLLVWAVGALAEGLGIRAVARVFEVDANTVLAWLVEAAEHLQAFSQYFLHDVRVTQLQLDELYARDGSIPSTPSQQTSPTTLHPC